MTENFQDSGASFQIWKSCIWCEHQWSQYGEVSSWILFHHFPPSSLLPLPLTLLTLLSLSLPLSLSLFFCPPPPSLSHSFSFEIFSRITKNMTEKPWPSTKELKLVSYKFLGNKNMYKLIRARMLTSMPPMCGYTDTGARIHPQWPNTWMSARTCVHATQARVRAYTHTCAHTHTHVHAHTRTHTRTCAHTHARARTHAHTHTCVVRSHARIHKHFEMQTTNVNLSVRREAEWR